MGWAFLKLRLEKLFLGYKILSTLATQIPAEALCLDKENRDGE
jgi:hypothetical protein